MKSGKEVDRRAVLRFLATSQVLATAGVASGLFELLTQPLSAQVPRSKMAPRERRSGSAG